MLPALEIECHLPWSPARWTNIPELCQFRAQEKAAYARWSDFYEEASVKTGASAQGDGPTLRSIKTEAS
jgi:hypothetical protein